MRSSARGQVEPGALSASPFARETFIRLWMLAAVTYGFGDVLTTVLLVDPATAVREANVLVVALVSRFGSPGLVGLKLAVFLTCIWASVDAARREDSVLYYLPPVLLSVLGAFTTAYNARLLLG